MESIMYFLVGAFVGYAVKAWKDGVYEEFKTSVKNKVLSVKEWIISKIKKG